MDADRSQNLFQRRYFAWAEPHYARMPPLLRCEVETLDRWLYSRAGLRFWAAIAGGAVVASLAIHAAGLPWIAAVALALVATAIILILTLSAWLQPDRYTTSTLAKFAVMFLVLSYLGAALGFLVGEPIRRGEFEWDGLGVRLVDLFRKATPALVVLFFVFAVLLWSVAAVRRLRVQRELEALRRTREADAVARQLAEARLKLLQGQIQPHFIFNTLAAVQHWVDRADARAGPLLRALTSFLRGSTDLFAEPEATLAAELAIVRHYLAIMAARLGDRLRYRIDVDERAALRSIPSGLLLTLVENAIEHGLSAPVDGGTIAIAAHEDAERWSLSVVDDGVGPVPGWRDGIGLANCRERLRHRFGDAARLALEREAGATAARVDIDVAAFR